MGPGQSSKKSPKASGFIRGSSHRFRRRLGVNVSGPGSFRLGAAFYHGRNVERQTGPDCRPYRTRRGYPDHQCPEDNATRANNSMKKTTKKRKATDELRTEYDLSKLRGGTRGKYFQRYRTGTNLVLLSPDVAQYFPDEQSVNTALRTLIRTGKPPFRRTR
jgi:hypothetical protein